MTSFRKPIQGILVAVLALTLAVPGIAYAEPTAAEKQAEAQEALNTLNAMQATLDKASNDYYAALDELDQATAAMNAAQARIDEASGQVAALQDTLGTRVKSMYRNGNTTLLDLVFGATSFEEFATLWDILSKMNEDDAAMVQQVKDLRAEIEEQRDEYAKQEAIASEKTEEAERIMDEAEATMASMQEIYNGLSAEAAALLEQERAAQEAAYAAQAASVVQAASDQAAASQDGGSSFVPTYDSVTGNATVDRALGCLGASYNTGGCGPSEFDCSGLVAYALTGSYSRLGSTHTFLGWPQVSDPQPGDIAVHESHCGIYMGNGQMVHASDFGVGVIIGPVQPGMVFVRY